MESKTLSNTPITGCSTFMPLNRSRTFKFQSCSGNRVITVSLQRSVPPQSFIMSQICLTCVVLLAYGSSSAMNHYNITMVGLFADDSAPLYTLPFTGPAVDTALQDVRTMFPNISLTFEILRQKEIITCADQVANLDLVAKFYYQKWDHQGVFLIVQPGKLHSGDM